MEMEMNHLPSSSSSDLTTTTTTTQNPRKKRSKLVAVSNSNSKPKPTTTTTTRKPPDPSAPKITRPCTECGKKFWSWKALFGHMRCHPERQWRGINPPPNFRPCPTTEEDDHEVAACLLMLANGPSPPLLLPAPAAVNQGEGGGIEMGKEKLDHEYNHCCRPPSPPPPPPPFECSSCKKVFGSHQALGGHRASHKNVKGCYAIASCRKLDDNIEHDHDHNIIMDHDNCDGGGHKCSICLRVFSSGQALGGHMRCHWEKVEDQHQHQHQPSSSSSRALSGSRGFDLNLPPPLQDDHAYSAIADMDLRLGL